MRRGGRKDYRSFRGETAFGLDASSSRIPSTCIVPLTAAPYVHLVQMNCIDIVLEWTISVIF